MKVRMEFLGVYILVLGLFTPFTPVNIATASATSDCQATAIAAASKCDQPWFVWQSGSEISNSSITIVSCAGGSPIVITDGEPVVVTECGYPSNIAIGQVSGDFYFACAAYSSQVVGKASVYNPSQWTTVLAKRETICSLPSYLSVDELRQRLFITCNYLSPPPLAPSLVRVETMYTPPRLFTVANETACTSPDSVTMTDDGRFLFVTCDQGVMRFLANATAPYDGLLLDPQQKCSFPIRMTYDSVTDSLFVACIEGVMVVYNASSEQITNWGFLMTSISCDASNLFLNPTTRMMYVACDRTGIWQMQIDGSEPQQLINQTVCPHSASVFQSDQSDLLAACMTSPGSVLDISCNTPIAPRLIDVTSNSVLL